MKNLNKAMVEYYETESSLLCAVNVNNLKLFNTELRINYSKHSTIDLSKNNKNQNSISFNEILIPGKEDHRYRKDELGGNIGKILKITFPLKDETDSLSLIEKLKIHLGTIDVALMLENRKEKFLHMRASFESI